ncbi:MULTISPECIES: hypothetical protein [unclassified Erwinia]|uniref:ECs1072 family phage-associated protein n=1 Tax=unclassified Erwinia TaxID=2622719 RepID=UPI00082F7D28|nr:hypothetical protein [Erwinia sp. ErVv1]
MSHYNVLWDVIAARVCQNSGTTPAEISDSNSAAGNAAKQRIAQIFILEVLLAKHRKTYSTRYLPLSGEDALHHLIFKRTGWLPVEIRSLSFNDSLFVLAELFREENLPAGANDFILKCGLSARTYPTDDFSEKDWAPRENEPLLSES